MCTLCEENEKKMQITEILSSQMGITLVENCLIMPQPNHNHALNYFQMYIEVEKEVKFLIYEHIGPAI